MGTASDMQHINYFLIVHVVIKFPFMFWRVLGS